MADETKSEKLVKELCRSVNIYECGWDAFKNLPATKEILASDRATKRGAIAFTVETIIAIWEKWNEQHLWKDLWFGNMVEGRVFPTAAMAICRKLLQKPLEYSQLELTALVARVAKIDRLSTMVPFLEPLVDTAERTVAGNELGPPLAQALEQLRNAICFDNAPETKLRQRIDRLLIERSAVKQTSQTERSENNSNLEFMVQARNVVAQLEKFARLDYRYKWKDYNSTQAVQTILSGSRNLQAAFVIATVEAIFQLRRRFGKSGSQTPLRFANLWHEEDFPKASVDFSKRLLRRELPFSDREVCHLVECLSAFEFLSLFSFPLLGEVVDLCEVHGDFARQNDTFSKHLAAMQVALLGSGRAAEKKLSDRVGTLLAPKQAMPIHPGEAWADLCIADLSAATAARRTSWFDLISTCASCSGSTPSPKWTKTAKCQINAVNFAQFKKSILAWFPLVDSPRTQPITDWGREYHPDPNHLIIEPNSDILKGLVWCCAFREDKEVARALTELALSAYRKIPLKGPREVKVGNACVIALGMMPGMEGVGQLALLKVRVKFGTAQKMIEKALETTAARVGIPRDELEEMAMPSYGLTSVGHCVEKFGDYTAELSIVGSDSTSISWRKPDGKTQQSIPALVKAKFSDDWKDFQGCIKDIQRMLPAQRERIDNLFREQKSWPFDKWRERYLDHTLVGVLARRLIWEFAHKNRTTTGIYFNGQLVDIDLRPLTALDENTRVQLWHPIGKDMDEIVAWRVWLEEQQIQQPFKQAHREIYLLTDAERHTNTYSNRFAAHILRQHQFNALCGARGWKNKLRLLVDAEFPPATLLLPKWNLRAEFWVDGIGENYGADTNESGVFNYLSTDQLRFYRMEANQVTSGGFRPGYESLNGVPAPEPLRLEEIPPVVFSEVMRDTDLFVGVASVGNDPTWNDGGPEGRYRDYWHKVSFGELNATAHTRREVLQRLVPRLKIAERCSFLDKFLVIRGDLRIYKIHLGSGNILMEPNDQYLCIVPKQVNTDDGIVMLPFEGDRLLSIILSKAFLLAGDMKIKDPTIIRQIKPPDIKELQS